MKKFVAALFALGSVFAISQSALASDATNLTIGNSKVFSLDKGELSDFVKTIQTSGVDVNGKIIGCTEGLEYSITRYNTKSAATCIVDQKEGSLKIVNFCSNEMVGTIQGQGVDLMKDTSSSLLKFAEENCGG